MFSVNSSEICMPDNLICTDLTTGVTITSWTWSIDGAEVSTEQNPTIPISGYTPGTSLLLCLDIVFGLGQEHQACQNIQVEQTPSIIINPSSVTLNCINTSEIITVAPILPGNYTYIWSGPTGTFNSQSITVSTDGVYTIEVTDIQTGCFHTEDFVVLGDYSIHSVDLGPSITLDCSSPINETLSALVSPAGTYTYQWTTSNGNITSGGNTATPTISMAGVYTVSVVNAINGCEVTASIIASNPPIPLNSVSPDQTICEGQTVNLAIDAPTAVSYLWSPTGETSSSILASPTSSTNYTVVASDANGCTVSESIFINVNLLPLANIAVPSVLCPNSSFEICALDDVGYSYQWEDPQGNIFTTQCIDINNPDISSNGTYNLTVTNISSGCINTGSFQHTVPEQIIANVTTQDPSCFGSTDGSIQLNVTGGNAPYNYEWENIIACQSTECSNLAAGLYVITITDSNACTLVESVQLTEAPVLAITNYTVECVGDDGTGGAIDISPTGGSTPYIYQWNNLETTEDIDDLIIGDYSITITDINGCIFVQTFSVMGDCVWPGDTDTNNVVNNYDLLNIGLVFDSTGTVRNAASLSWYGQAASNWSQTVPGTTIDYKHVDTDGNGIINSDDTLAITLNWGQSHNLRENTASPRNTLPLYVQEDTVSQGEMMSLPIILGDMDNPAIDIYGIAFSVSYDTSVVSFGSSNISFMNSWLGMKGLNMITIQKDFPVSGRVDLAISRTDGMNISGSGEIGRLNIIIEDDILLQAQHGNPRNEEEKEIKFVIDGVKLINRVGEILEVNPLSTSSLITQSPLSNPSILDLGHNITLYPNPTRDLLTIQSETLKVEYIELFSVMGQVLIKQSTDSNKVFLNTHMLNTGTYLIRIKTAQGTIIKRANILR